MSAKATGWPCALILSVVLGATCGGPSFGQTADPEVKPAQPSSAGDLGYGDRSSTKSQPPNVNGQAATEASSGPTPTVPGTLSAWLTYHRPDCCGPIGGDGPIFTELFVRTGPAFTAAGSDLMKVLQPGWEIEGGGRSLFYNPAETAAFTAEVSLSHTYHHAQPNPTVPYEITFTFPLPAGVPATLQPAPVNQTIPIIVRDMQMTFVNASVGGEWYLTGQADSPSTRWRTGFDVGGRLGTAKADITEIIANPPKAKVILGNTINAVQLDFRAHLTDTLYGPFGALHTDVEIPTSGCCTFVGGLRLELDYISCDILKGLNNSNLVDVNVLGTFGMRF